MSTYTVVSASQKKTDIPGKYGPMQDITLVLRNGAGMEKTVSWYTKATTALPQPGSTVEGDVEQTEYGPKFKKAQQQDGGFKNGGGRPRDPQERKSIQAQHAQKCAADIVRLGLSSLSTDGTTPATVDTISEAVERVAERLFRQVEALSA